MQNIEFKAELRDMFAARVQCELLKARHVGRLRQADTYFRMPDGRLKKRQTIGERTQWIFYHRAERTRPKLSNYTILSDEQARIRWGTHSLKKWLCVTKVRDLWLLDNVRIHLDVVDDLGEFLEFEAMISPQIDVEHCHRVLSELRDAFDPVLGEAIAVSYCDLLEQHKQLQAMSG